MSRRTRGSAGGADERNGCLDGASMPRYEFRVWSRSFEGARRDLAVLASACVFDEPHEEIYLLAAARPDRNAKIRNGRLVLKALVATRDGLERWQPRLDESFPISAGMLAAWVLPELGIPLDRLRREAYGQDAFLAELIAPDSAAVALALTKERLRFRLPGTRAEVAGVTIAGGSLRTLAIESVDPAAVRALVARLGLEGWRNVGYDEALKAILRDTWDFQG